MPQSNPFVERINALTENELELLESAIAIRHCRNQYGFGTFAEAAKKYRLNPSCPSCHAPLSFKDGISSAGLQRYRCRACGFRYNSLTGTIFERSKKDLCLWIDFISMMCWNLPLDAIAQLCGISHQTAFEWRHRVFATVDNYQNKTILQDTIWIDEIYINDTDLTYGYGESKKRGLSKQKLCIAVGIDIYKHPVAIVCRHGKPSTKRVKDALLSHIKEGSHIIHDKERAHNGLIKAAKCKDSSYKANVKDSEYLECMSMINNLCSWLKRYLWRFVGMDSKNTQSYLNWYVYLFRVNQEQEKWPKNERVIRHLLMSETQFRSSRV